MLAITNSSRFVKHGAILGLICAALLSPAAGLADALADARLLLRVSNSAAHFEHRTRSQTNNILRTYASIIAMERNVELPPQLRAAIAECYAREYAWDNFSAGFAEILAEHLSQPQLQLLIGFYRNRGIPPSQIPDFRAAIAKAGLIEEMSADYIFANSPGCVQQDARLITAYINSLELVPLLELSGE